MTHGYRRGIKGVEGGRGAWGGGGREGKGRGQSVAPFRFGIGEDRERLKYITTSASSFFCLRKSLREALRGKTISMSQSPEKGTFLWGGSSGKIVVSQREEKTNKLRTSGGFY